MNIKLNISLLLISVLWAMGLSAQTAEKYEQRYNLLLSQFGPAGVGVETVLDKWAEVDSTSSQLLYARFRFYFTKAQTTSVVVRQEKKYLGMDPLLSLKDSLGRNVYYYQVNEFDDHLYGQAIKVIDKAISRYPDRLDLRFVKANAYIAYEKESPDMALSYLTGLVDVDQKKTWPWLYEGDKVEDGFFEDSMQEYCYSFYSIGTPSSMKAFLILSEKMVGLYPEHLEYLNNIGSYHLISKDDPKTALKWYSKVLKKNPKDGNALQNSIVAARRLKNAKLEKKYRDRLDALNKEK